MSELHDTGREASGGPRQGEDRGTGPRWLRFLGLVSLVVLVLLIAMYITGDAFRDHPPPVT